MEAAFFLLLAAFCWREWHFSKVQKDLLALLMSRDYSSYKFAENYGKQDKANAPVVEDFSEPDTLEGINPLA